MTYCNLLGFKGIEKSAQLGNSATPFVLLLLLLLKCGGHSKLNYHRQQIFNIQETTEIR